MDTDEVINKLDEINDLAENLAILGGGSDNATDDFHEYMFNLPTEIAIIREFALNNMFSNTGLELLVGHYIHKNREKLLEWKAKVAPSTSKH